MTSLHANYGREQKGDDTHRHKLSCQSLTTTAQAHVLMVDTEMDTWDENHMEGEKMEQTTDNHLASNETHGPLDTTEGPSTSCRTFGAGSKPRLHWMKSYPPYSQCIGGLGHWVGEPAASDSPLQQRKDDREEEEEEEEEGRGLFQGTRNDTEGNPRCAKDELRAKWKMRRRGDRSSGSYEAERWDRGRWSGRRRAEENGRGREEGPKSQWVHWGSSSTSSVEADLKEEEDEERHSVSVDDGENEAGGDAPVGKDEKAEGERGGSVPHQWTAPHPILSKLLHSSSSSSSSCSINFSSAESDEVFSDGEDVGKKRKMLRKCPSWKTYMTMMHWSLRRQSSWVQVAGHQGNFQLSERGEVLKLYSEGEAECLDHLMRDPLRPFVPQFHGTVTRGEHRYIRLEDLLSGLRRPVILDCKMGVRTYPEEELTKATMRSDMYQKMLKTDPLALSAEEHTQRAVSKLRYLQWKDTTSSTSTLGLRIEGIMKEDGSVQRDFKKIRTLSQITEAMIYFTGNQLDILKSYHSRLLDLSDTLTNSPFFRSHEVIGSSLLFVHNHSSKASVWMIDFGKTAPVHHTTQLQHNIPWVEGSREDGYLIGLTSLITSLSQAITVASCQE